MINLPSLCGIFDTDSNLALRFGVPVCPHAGGVGLCEYVIHLRYDPWFSSPLASAQFCFPTSLIDYIAVSGTMERNVLEFVDHLHEHFLYPCSINSKGRYNVPSNPEEGYRYITLRRTRLLMLTFVLPHSFSSTVSRWSSRVSQSSSTRTGRIGLVRRRRRLPSSSFSFLVHTRGASFGRGH